LNVQEGVTSPSAVEDWDDSPLGSLSNFEGGNLSLDYSAKDASRHGRDGIGWLELSHLNVFCIYFIYVIYRDFVLRSRLNHPFSASLEDS
jgi:hypothetical protein